MGETANETHFVIRPELSENELEPLFADAWGPGSAKGYKAVLDRSLGYIGAFRNAELVGFVNLAWDGGAHTFLLDTVVRSDCRREGIGIGLVRRAIELARDSGIEWVHVDFEPHLDSFYEQAGLHSTSARLFHFERPRSE